MKTVVTKSIIVSAVALSSVLSFAGILKGNLRGNKVNRIDVLQSADLTLSGGQANPVKLTNVGVGTRTLEFGPNTANIFVGQLLVSKAEEFVRSTQGTQALDSTAAQSAVAVKIDFLRPLPSNLVVASFQGSLRLNGVDLNRPDVKQFLGTIAATPDAVSGDSVVIAGEVLTDGTEQLTFEDQKGKVTKINGSKLFIRSVLSIILGATLDDGLKALKEEIISGNGVL